MAQELLAVEVVELHFADAERRGHRHVAAGRVGHQVGAVVGGGLNRLAVLLKHAVVVFFPVSTCGGINRHGVARHNDSKFGEAGMQRTRVNHRGLGVGQSASKDRRAAHLRPYGVERAGEDKMYEVGDTESPVANIAQC